MTDGSQHSETSVTFYRGQQTRNLPDDSGPHGWTTDLAYAKTLARGLPDEDHIAVFAAEIDFAVLRSMDAAAYWNHAEPLRVHFRNSQLTNIRRII